jgi:hypothetical protein
MPPPVVLATTTWNCVDIIDRFLEHNRRIGVHRVYVVDFHSDDGTREVLTSAKWRSYVEMRDLPSLKDQDTSNQLLAVIRPRHPGEWCLFCDPDEFLATANMAVADLFPPDWESLDAVAIPRFTLSAPQSAARAGDLEEHALDRFTLRIARQHRHPREQRDADVIVPPWIYSAILNKTMARLDAIQSVADGDHAVFTREARPSGQAADAFLLHFPIRSFRDFAAKVELYRLDYEANPGEWGWHQRRWIRLLDAGRLREEYLAQFIPDDDVDDLVQRGVLAHERRIARVPA